LYQVYLVIMYYNPLLALLPEGAHMNPAITLAFAVVQRLDWIKVPVYWLAQLLGAFIASAAVYGIYYGKIESWISYNASLKFRAFHKG